MPPRQRARLHPANGRGVHQPAIMLHLWMLSPCQPHASHLENRGGLRFVRYSTAVGCGQGTFALMYFDTNQRYSANNAYFT